MRRTHRALRLAVAAHLHQRLDATEARGVGKDLRGVAEALCRLVPGGELEGEHRAEPPHLRGGERMSLVPAEAGVEHVRHVIRLGEELRDRLRVCLRALEPNRQRPQPAEREERFERPRRGAVGVALVTELLRDLVVPDHDAHQEVGMAADQLRRAMDDEVGTER